MMKFTKLLLSVFCVSSFPLALCAMEDPTTAQDDNGNYITPRSASPDDDDDGGLWEVPFSYDKASSPEAGPAVGETRGFQVDVEDELFSNPSFGQFTTEIQGSKFAFLPQAGPGFPSDPTKP